MQGKAEDEGILTYVEDDNAAMCSPGRRTCSDICLVCYSYTSISLDGHDSWDDLAYLYDANNPTVTPTVTVMDGDKTLTAGTDYTVEIANNTGSPDNMVEAVVIVSGKGDYYGTQTKTFRITPFNIADCELKGKLEAYNDGYGPYYPLCNNVEVWNGNTKLMCDTDYTIELDNSIDIYDGYEIGQTYTATIKGTGDWGGTKTFEFTFVALSHTIVFDANGGTGTMANAGVGNDPGRYYLPECTFTPQYGYEFDYWKVDYEGIEENPIKQPGDYFSAPHIWGTDDVQTITVTAHWKEKAKYSVTLPDNMELVSGIVDNDGKAYKDEVITFKVVDGCSVFGEVKVGDTVLTAENGIYTVTVTADTTVSAIVLDDNTCYFDESTSTLHLRGNVKFADVQNYKDSAVYVVAEKGAVLPENSTSLFDCFTQATSIDLANADTSSVTNMSCMFYFCKTLTTLDLSSFDTSSVTDMSSMFNFCNALTSLNLSSFDTSSVTDMSNMFSYCHALTSLDLSSFDTSSVTNMGNMFMMRSTDNTLTTIYVSENWNTDKVTYSNNMFTNCTKLKGGNGTAYDSEHLDKTYAVIDGQAGQTGYLTGTYALALPDNMEIVTDSDKKVGGRYLNGAVVKLKYTGTVPEHHYLTVKAGYTELTPDENGIYTLTVTDNTAVSTDMELCKYTVTLPNNMEFVGTVSEDYEYGTAVSFKAKDGYIVKGDVTANGTASTAENGIYTLYVTGNMTVSANVDVESYFDSTTGTLTLKGTVLKNSGFFGSVILPYGVNRSNVLHIVVDAEGATLPQDSSCLFYDFRNVQSIDLTRANTSNVTDMCSMFENCQSLTSLDLSGFDTSSVTDMSYMFCDCYALETLDLSSFDTRNVESMDSMFCDCYALTTLDLSSFDTSRVTNMSYMFAMESTITVDAGGNIVSTVNNSLTTIYVGKNWNMDSIETYTKLKSDSNGDIIEITGSYDTDMFENCIHLKGGTGTAFDNTKTDKTYARIDKDGQPGYFTGLYTLTLPENMEIVTDASAENKVGNRYLKGAEVTFKVKEGYTAGNVQANGTALTAENGIYTVTVEENVNVFADFQFSDGVGARLAGHSLSLTGNIGVNFYMELDSTVAANPNAYMHFTLPNGTTQDVTVAEALKKTVSGKTYYVFQCETAAKEMTDKITAQMFSGDKSGEVYEYTVKEYADYLFKNAYEEDGVTVKNQSYVDAYSLIESMVNYGAYSQIYFNHNTDALANDGRTNTDISGVTAETVDMPYDNSTENLPEGVTFAGANLVLESETVMNLYFTNTTGKALTFTTDDNVTLTQEQSGKYTKVTITDIAAQNLDKYVTVNVAVEDENTEYSVKYSPMNYCYNTLSRETTATRTDALKDVMRALYLYNSQAKAYFAAQNN